MALQVEFRVRAGPLPLYNILRIPDDGAVILNFALKQMQDTGGTLKFQININSKEPAARVR